MRLGARLALKEWTAQMGRVHVPKLEASIEANERLYKQFRTRNPNIAAALKQHIDILPYGRIRPVTFVGLTLWDEHMRAFERAALGKATPEEALADGQKIVQKELDAFYKQQTYPVIDLKLPLAFCALGLMGLGAWLFIRYRRGHHGVLAKHEIRWAYLFISPWIIGFLVFTLWPMLASLFFSFTQYNVLSDARWVGAKNYVDLFQTDHSNIGKAIFNIVYLAGIGVPLGLVTGLAVAFILNAATGGIRVYRTLFYMPAVMPKVAAAVLWVWLLAPDPHKGLINSVWQATITNWFDIAPPAWLHAEHWAKPSLILMGIWGAGSGMILWLAGLKNIPKNLYEAASIDGANPSQQLWSITLPQLSPIILFNMVMGLITALQEFERIYIMKPTESTIGPADSLLVPAYYLFTNGFNYFKMGYASAIAWVLFLLVLILTLFQLKFASKWVYYEVEK
jgi:multiple sugar transport system permease protein